MVVYRPFERVLFCAQWDLGDAGQRQNSGSAVLVLLRPIGCTISLHNESGH